MAATLTTMDKILKEDYIGPVRYQLNARTILVNRLEKSSDIRRGINGLQGYLPLNIQRNHGIGARAQVGAILPSAGNQGYTNAAFDITAQYGRIEIENSVIKMARSDVGSFLRAVEAEMRGLKKNVSHDQNRQMLNDGSGVITLCGTTTASLTVTVDSTANLEVGMIIDILTASTGVTVTDGTKRTIATIPSSTTFTMTGNVVTTASTDAVYRHGNRILEIFGIDYITDDGNGTNGTANFGGISRTTNTNNFWQGNVLSDPNSNDRPISVGLLEDMLTEIFINGGQDGDGVSVIVTNPFIKANYGKLVYVDKRYKGDGKPHELDAGWTGLSYSDIPFLADKHCKDNTLYMLDEACLVLFETNDWDWMDEDGAVLSRVQDRPAYEAVLERYMQLGAYSCNVHAKLENVEH